MTRSVISPAEGAELKRLYQEFVAASANALAVLQAEGMESARFLEADKAAGAIQRRIREILGISGSHWMA